MLVSLGPGGLSYFRIATSDCSMTTDVDLPLSVDFPSPRSPIGIAELAASTSVLASDPSQWTKHYEVNVIGPVILFQAFHSLLKAAPSKAPKYVIISSNAGSTSFANSPAPMGVYGTSKAAVNHVAIKIHAETEQDGFVVYPVHPGECFDLDS